MKAIKKKKEEKKEEKNEGQIRQKYIKDRMNYCTYSPQKNNNNKKKHLPQLLTYLFTYHTSHAATEYRRMVSIKYKCVSLLSSYDI